LDGTLIEAWASLKSFRPKGEQRSDQTPGVTVTAIPGELL
jgi:hypothetical protein